MIPPSPEHFRHLNLKASRMVENQQRSATLELVSYDIEKHEVLEELIEHSKPGVEPALSRRHYLIKTPFRYPPLKHGSRFGSVAEQGIFYCSLSFDCLLSEVAYYRFVFLRDMDVAFDDPIKTEHSVFDVRIESDSALLLDDAPWDQWRDSLSDPANYRVSQDLGKKARAIDTDVIRFYSARDTQDSRNLAVLNHKAIKGSPSRMRSIRCEVEGDRCVFTDIRNNKLYLRQRFQFERDGFLPSPA